MIIKLAKLPILGLMLVFCFRIGIGVAYLRRVLSKIFIWLFCSRETTNFTYDLESTNRRYLASMISDVLGCSSEEIIGYFRELEEDTVLKQHIADKTKNSEMGFIADVRAKYGRRIGWYAFVRATKPSVVVETGVDKGFGSCILTTALMKNRLDGYNGFYYGTDINPRAGYLFSEPYRSYGKILYGDSIISLSKLDRKIDIFINDSDHSPQYEKKEYEIIRNKIGENCIILGDNSHYSDRLLEFSSETGRNFVFFQEKPASHWYPGSGIGISFRRR